ncbi:hypothetical protein [Terrabacter sp. 2RAF25]|uniref:hypothetical protein n=1 Tax=Terrabacter sp. 2RAF25 TaxID=3232998 RepID=UPI003F9A715A
MNLTDLREELTAHADDLGTAPDFRAGVAARVMQTKRRRATTAGAGAALAVVALAVGVMTSVGRPAPSVPAGTPSSVAPMLGADGMPLRTVPDAPGDITRDGLRLRANVAGDHLGVGVIGSVGGSLITADWTPTTTHVSLTGECYLPGADQALLQRAQLRIMLQGAEGYFGTGCRDSAPTDRDLPVGGWEPGEPGQGWPELTLGRREEVVMRVVDGKTGRQLDLPGVRIVGAVYEQGDRRAIRDGAGTTRAALPEAVEHQGYRYRLTAVSSGPLATGGLPQLDLPTTGPVLVNWGSAGDGLTGTSAPDGTTELRLEGLRDGAQGRGYGASGVVPVPAGAARSLRLVAQGARPDHGVGFIAVYTLTPDPRP